MHGKIKNIIKTQAEKHTYNRVKILYKILDIGAKFKMLKDLTTVRKKQTRQW